MISLEVLVERLKNSYGPPKTPQVTDPLEMILFETVAYLAPDTRREAAFEALRARVGTTAAAILAAPLPALIEICGMGGIHPALRAGRLREIAAIVKERFQGDLRTVFALSSKTALKELTRFPSIAAPGAEKILLFAQKLPVMALELNGVRVLARIFFGAEQKNYSATYRAIRTVVEAQTGDDCAWIIGAHQLLRQHGQECCKRNHPSCSACPLTPECRYFQALNQ